MEQTHIRINQSTHDRLKEMLNGRSFDSALNDILDNYDAALEVAEMWKDVRSETHIRLLRQKKYKGDSLDTVINALLDGESIWLKKE